MSRICIYSVGRFNFFRIKRYAIVYSHCFLPLTIECSNLSIVYFLIQGPFSNNYSSEYRISSSLAKDDDCTELRAACCHYARRSYEFFVSIFNRVNINRYRHCIVKVTAHSRKKLKPDCAGVSLIAARSCFHQRWSYLTVV